MATHLRERQPDKSQEQSRERGRLSWMYLIVVMALPFFTAGAIISILSILSIIRVPWLTILSLVFTILGVVFIFFQLFPPSSTSKKFVFQSRVPQSLPPTHTASSEQHDQAVKDVNASILTNRDLPREDWGEAPHVSQFYGRDKECTELEHWIVDDHCQLVAVLGIGGIGKTALAAKLVEQIKDEFEYVFWRSLQNAPPLEGILKNCIQFFYDHQRIDLPRDTDAQIALLLQYLRDHRCLLVLDNVETVLQPGNPAGQYRGGYEGYGRLFERVGEAKHQSCLVLTSREKLKELVRLEGKTSPVRSLQLSGLGQAEGQKLLKDKGLFGSDETWAYLIHLYSGNPLALKLASEPIRELFGGDVVSFIQQGKAVFGDIRDPLDLQFTRLSELEREIMYWLAIEREAVSLDDLRGDIVHPVTEGDLLVAVGSLRRRSLIETCGPGRFTLQPVIMEYVTDRFVEEVREEIDAEAIRLFGSHVLIKAQTKDYKRDSQVRLILMPVAEGLLTSLGKEEAEKKLRRTLSILRETHPQTGDYAAGNVLNLLIQLECDLRGYDFSYLTVRQAYLQNIALPDVNFAHADLATSVFTSIFGSILSVALSSYKDILAGGTANGEIQLWNATSGTPLLTCQGHTDWVWSVAFSPDGNLLASASSDQTVRLWEVSTGQCLKILQGHSSLVRTVAFSPDGRVLASGSEDKTVRLWEASTGQCFNVLSEHTNRVYSVAFSPDGNLLASGSSDQTVRLWEINTGQLLKTLQGHSSWIWSVAFSPDGRTLASGSDDQTVRLWEVSTGQLLKTLQGHTNRVYSVAFSPDGNLLASGSNDQTVRLWEVSTSQLLKTLQGHTNRVWSVAFNPNGTLLASGSDDQTVRLWEVSTGQLLKTLQGHANRVYSVAFSPDGRTLASGSNDQTVRLWEVSTDRCLKALQGHTNRIRSVAFSPNGTLLASGSEDETVRLWEVSTGQLLKTLQGHTNRVWSVAFNPNGTLLASGSEDEKVRLWEVSTGQLLKTLQGHTNQVRAVAFSPDGNLLASGSNDQTVRLWEVSTGQLLKTLQGHTNRVYSVAFNPDGSLLVSSGEDQAIRLWEVDTGQCLNVLLGHSSWIWSVAFSPSGKLLASGSNDQTVRLWEISTGRCLKSLQGHANRVWSVVFSPDANLLASGNNDGTIRLWNIQTHEYLKTLRSDRLYERMNIAGAIGLTEAQKVTLRVLGAIEDERRAPG